MTLRQPTICQAMIATSVVIALTSSAPAEAEKASAGGKLIDDPFLNHFALGLLFFVVAML